MLLNLQRRTPSSSSRETRDEHLAICAKVFSPRAVREKRVNSLFPSRFLDWINTLALLFRLEMFKHINQASPFDSPIT